MKTATIFKTQELHVTSFLLSEWRDVSTRQIFTETRLTQSIIVQIIHCDLGLKWLFRLRKRLFPIIICFSDIYISQGSVATHLRRGGIFDNHFVANFPQSVSVE